MTTYNELSPTAKRRLKAMAVCPLCGKAITDMQTLEYLIFQNGKWKSYVFFHTECLREFIKENNNGKSEAEQRETQTEDI